MKYLTLLLFVLINTALYSQKPCDYSENITDSIGSYKITKEYMISEKNFGTNKSYIFFSLAMTDGLPTLNVQTIQKSKDFIKANCFDKNSRIYLQLNNGKIVTLIHVEQENCGTILRDDNQFDNRINSGIFMFAKENYEDLKTVPISLMRIKYLTDTEDHVIKKEFISELNNVTYTPENYFINYLKCVE